MSSHELKTWPESFSPVMRGEKKAEHRLDDRGYAVGDELLLREWVPGLCEYTGRELTCRVTHVLRGPEFGVREGWVILSVETRGFADRGGK